MRFLRSMLLLSCTAAAVCGCACGSGESVPDATQAGKPAEIATDNAILLDVRSAEEFASGHLRGAHNIPHDRIAEEIASVAPDKTVPVILYCHSGRRAGTALNTLKAMGYENVSNFGGLEDAQERLGLPVDQD